MYIIKMNYFSVIIIGFFFTIDPCFSYEVVNELVTPENRLLPLFDNIPFPPPGVIPMLNRKIFRGRRVSIREHPYVASIRRKVAHYLVGTIIAKNLVLTVAYPLVNVSISELSVVVGENYADRGSMLHTVILVIVHEDFNQYTLEHDIALIRIYEDITYKGSAKSIPLFDVDDLDSIQGQQAFVTGWGRCDRTGKELCLPRSTRYTGGEIIDPMLRTISFYIKENDTYCDIYKRKGLYVGPGMLCQGRARAQKVTAECLSVPGAALVIQARLAGILSWGFGCGHSHDLPLIYTNTQFYDTWIVNNILVLRAIPKVYLTKLFQATRAYILMEWLRLTRVVQADTLIAVDRDMEALYVDKDLAKLSGTVYDIRDYLYGGIHHQYKMDLYQNLRQSLEKNVVTENKHIDMDMGKDHQGVFYDNKIYF